MTERREPATEAGREANWTCSIGPADLSRLPAGSDLPMRMAVREAFIALTGHPEAALSSGWGRIEAQATDARVAALMEALRAIVDGSQQPSGTGAMYGPLTTAKRLLSDFPAAAVERPQVVVTKEPGPPLTAAGRELDSLWDLRLRDGRLAIIAIEAEAIAMAERDRRVPLDVERLRAAIFAVSVRHDWAYVVDDQDRTEEIAAEYARLSESD